MSGTFPTRRFYFLSCVPATVEASVALPPALRARLSFVMGAINGSQLGNHQRQDGCVRGQGFQSGPGIVVWDHHVDLVVIGGAGTNELKVPRAVQSLPE